MGGTGEKRTQDRSQHEPGSSYGYAAAQAAVHTAGRPWDFATALANDAATAMGDGARLASEAMGQGRRGLPYGAAHTQLGANRPGGGRQLYHETSGQMRDHDVPRASGLPSPTAAGPEDHGWSELADSQWEEQARLSSLSAGSRADSQSLEAPSFASSGDEAGGAGGGPPGADPDANGGMEEPTAAPPATLPRADSATASHYNPQNDVILRLEYISPNETRFAIAFVWGAIVLGLAALLGIFIKKETDIQAHAFKDFMFQKWDVAVGAFLWLLCALMLGTFLQRVYQSYRLKKVWKHRRKRSAQLLFCELVVQFISITFFLIPNIDILARGCGAFFGPLQTWSGWVRWSCWNTIFALYCVHGHNGNPIRLYCCVSQKAMDSAKHNMAASNVQKGDSIVLDGPLWLHWPKLLYWLLTEAVLITTVTYYQYGGHERQVAPTVPPGAEQDCSEWDYHCSISGGSLGLTIACVVLFVGYFVMYVLYLRRTVRALQKRPYKEYKMANLITTMQIRTRLVVFTYFVLCIILIWLVQPGSCYSYIANWLGLLPMQVVASAVCLCWAFFATPRDPKKEMPALQVWLQEFAWTEAEKPARMRLRASTTGGEVAADLAREPMFCFETALKCLFWTAFVYDYQEVKDSPLTLEKGLKMWGLQHSELFWEKDALDTKVILAWGPGRVLLAFRGTASFKNMLADIKAWPTVHPPRRGRCWRRPRVHAGFLAAWRAAGLCDRVIERVRDIMKSSDVDLAQTKFIVTGHSLGGALATLAAYDIVAAASHLPDRCLRRLDISVYTFGAPRTGNHAFASDYGRRVPDTWHIINDQDVVARGAKFWGLYKRPGQRVLINKQGDMIVRPTFVEVSLQQRPAGASVAQHLLVRYKEALLSVCAGQFTRKGTKAGMTGVVRLAEANTGLQELLTRSIGVPLEQLRRMSRWGPERLAAHLPKRVVVRIHRVGALPPSIAENKEALSVNAAGAVAADPSDSGEVPVGGSRNLMRASRTATGSFKFRQELAAAAAAVEAMEAKCVSKGCTLPAGDAEDEAAGTDADKKHDVAIVMPPAHSPVVSSQNSPSPPAAVAAPAGRGTDAGGDADGALQAAPGDVVIQVGKDGDAS